MATGVGHGGICLMSFNSPTPKTPAVLKAKANAKAEQHWQHDKQYRMGKV